MKRARYLIVSLLMTVILPVFLACAGMVISATPVLAATPTPAPANLNLMAPDKCVQIALPFLNGGSKCVDNSPANGGAIVQYLKTVLQLMSMAVGIVIVLMLVIAGVQYTTSAADPTNVKAAKNRIVNALIALVLFMFMVLILQFIVPGGIL